MTDVVSEQTAWTHGTRPALPRELDDEQRELIRRFFIDHPDGGYKQAARAAGIHATQAEAKALIGGDDELRQFRLATLGLDELSLFARLGEMAQDSEHRDQYRAVTFGLTALHGYGAQRVEHTGAGGGPVEVTIEHDHDRLIDKLAAVGLIRRGPLTAPDAEAQRLLPAPPD